MKIKFQNTKLTDGSIVTDLNIFANGAGKNGDRKVIFSCTSKEDARKFWEALEALIEKHTVETIEFDPNVDFVG